MSLKGKIAFNVFSSLLLMVSARVHGASDVVLPEDHAILAPNGDSCIDAHYGQVMAQFGEHEISSAQFAKDFGVAESHVSIMQSRANRRDSLIALRARTPYDGALPTLYKPGSVPYKTLKKGPYRGLVGWRTRKAPSKVVARLDPEYVIIDMKNGWSLLRTRTKPYLFVESDADMAFAGRWINGELTIVDTNSNQFWENNFRWVVPQVFWPMLSHGAQDDYRDASGSPLLRYAPNEKFYVLGPNGAFHLFPATNVFRQMYKVVGKEWREGQ